MVYPEKLSIDQVAKKISSPNTSASWCDEPLEENSNNIHIQNETKIEIHQNGTKNNRIHVESYNKPAENITANRQFIQDRIRHLVEAFSTRTQETRERIETPGTPSSISSRETTHQTPLTTRKKLNSITLDEKIDEVPQDETKSRKFIRYIKYNIENRVIDPNGKIYICWMFVAAAAVLYNAWVIPFRSTFPYQNKENRLAWMSFDYLADFVYIVDIILIQPRVKYLHEGFWVTDITLLRQNYYKKKYFKFDLISLFPLDLLYFIFGPEVVILRFPRFFKVHTFWDFTNFLDKLLANPNTIRITKTLMYMMFLIHLNACAYYGFSLWEGIGSNHFVYDGKGNAYIRCYYFATKTATSIGKNPKPTQDVEYMFMTVSWLTGVFVFALLIGQIRDLISTATRSKTEYRKLVDETLQYMRRMNLPQDVQRKAQLWFNYTWKTQRTLDENTIMDCLPHKMKTDIAINVHIQTLSKVTLFADCDEALLRELVLQLKSVIYLPGDIICKKGDVGKEMYILQSGKVQVIGRTESEVLATLCEGSVFGEISLLGIPGKNRRTADVRSQGHSNLFVLSKADLNAALTQYPEAQELLNKKAKLLMKKNAALERKHNALIVINNPTPPPKQAKLLDTVLQVIPSDSKTNKLLRYGSRGYRQTHSENEKFKYRNSLPSLKNFSNIDKTFQSKVTVHRTLS